MIGLRHLNFETIYKSMYLNLPRANGGYLYMHHPSCVVTYTYMSLGKPSHTYDDTPNVKNYKGKVVDGT
jgi:hypothetical protein